MINVWIYKMKPYLSIIIPAHNEERRLPKAFGEIDAYLKTKEFEYEVLVVENGSHDKTADITRQYVKKMPYLKLVEVDTRGKGLAVKAGMLEAQGDHRFICDADLSMPIAELDKFLTPDAKEYDIVIGSREGEGALRVGEPWHRHLMGRILNMIIKITAVRGFEDTQCGFKMFSKRVAEDLFSIQRMHGIGFDVELMFVARKRGYKIKQIPITWYFDPDSRMKLFQDSLHMLLEIFEIRKNWLLGNYGHK